MIEYRGKTDLFYKNRRKWEVKRSLVDVPDTSFSSEEQGCWGGYDTEYQMRPKNADDVAETMCNTHGYSPQSIPTGRTLNCVAVIVA